MATKKVNKSAVSGKFVSNAAVKRSPSTTVSQTVKTPRKTSKKSR